MIKYYLLLKSYRMLLLYIFCDHYKQFCHFFKYFLHFNIVDFCSTIEKSSKIQKLILIAIINIIILLFIGEFSSNKNDDLTETKPNTLSWWPSACAILFSQFFGKTTVGLFLQVPTPVLSFPHRSRREVASLQPINRFHLQISDSGTLFRHRFFITPLFSESQS